MPRDMLIQVRAGTSAEWAAANPVLEENEPGYVTDTHSVRFGDGTTPFSDLPSMSGGISVSEAIITRQVPYVPAIPDIVDPGFEEATLTGWAAFEVGTAGDKALTLSSSQFHGGEQSLEVQMSGSSAVYGVYQDLDLRDTTHITIWVYSSSNCDLMMTADPAPVDFTDFENVGTPPNMEWAQYSYEIPEEFRVKDGVIMIGIQANVGGPVTAYLDDVSYIVDGPSDECNFIPDIDQYIKDEVDTRLGLPAKTTAKQIVFRPVTGESEDYDWIPDLDAYIDDEIDTHLNLPDKTLLKQVPYRSPLRNLITNGTMDDGPLIPPEHGFTLNDVNASINENHLFDVTTTINENHNFANTTARDDYFIAHPGELVEGVLVFITGEYEYQRYLSTVWTTQYNPDLTSYMRDAYFIAHPEELTEGLLVGYVTDSPYYYKYISSTWTSQNRYDLIEELMDDYFTDNPEEEIEGAVRYYDTFGGLVYEKYTDSAWTAFETEDYYGGWLPGYQGSVNNYELVTETTEQHSGTGCLKTTFSLGSYSGFFGAGVSQQNVDLTYATHVSIWLKGVGDAIGKYVTETDSTYSSQQEITGEWAQYTFEIHSGSQTTGQTLKFLVGTTYADPEDEYEVLWDDCVLTGGIENELEWIEDIDTYFDDQYCADDDSRLSDARTPNTHATSHVTGGDDVIANVVAAGNSGLMSGADKTKLDELIDFDVPEKISTKQVPYRPSEINIFPHGDMETLFVSPEHMFTLSKIDAEINENHFFADTTARDTYFGINSGELVEGVLVAIIDSPINAYYRYESSAWVEYSEWDAYDLIVEIMNDYYTDNPEEEYEGATRAFDWGLWLEYDIYIDGSWEENPDSDERSSGWLGDDFCGQYYYDLTIDTSEQHSGDGCLKTVFTLDDRGEYFNGAGVCQFSVDLTYTEQIKIWIKGAGDAIGKQVMVSEPFQSDPQTITDEWVEYSFDVPEEERGLVQSVEFVVGGESLDASNIYTVYWDDCTLYGEDLEPKIEWINDIDTYFEDVYLNLPENPVLPDGVIPVFYPGFTLITDPTFIAVPSSWSTYSHSEAGVTPAISSLNTNVVSSGSPPYRQIYFVLGTDGTSEPAMVSHRYAFSVATERPVTGSIRFIYYGSSTRAGLSLWLEKIGSDGETVLGTVAVDPSVISSTGFSVIPIDGINDIEGSCGGIGLRLELESTAEMLMHYVQISAPSCILESETEYVAEETMSRWRGTAASDPSDSRGGDMYYNTNDSKVYLHNGTAYIALT